MEISANNSIKIIVKTTNRLIQGYKAGWKVLVYMETVMENQTRLNRRNETK